MFWIARRKAVNFRIYDNIKNCMPYFSSVLSLRQFVNLMEVASSSHFRDQNIVPLNSQHELKLSN
mgnify:CR=1 FL=1